MALLNRILSWIKGIFRKKSPHVSLPPEVKDPVKDPIDPVSKLPLLPRKYEYLSKYQTLTLRTEYAPEVYRLRDKIRFHRDRYEPISKETGVPWDIIGVIHYREVWPELTFTKHLFNGDPLTARTVQVPAGQPTKGKPPFTFEFSAIEALKYDRLAGKAGWDDIDRVGYALERYNGLGYRNHGVNSPYLWSFSNHYTSGYYVRDGVFDQNAKNKQAGTLVLLKALRETL